MNHRMLDVAVKPQVVKFNSCKHLQYIVQYVYFCWKIIIIYYYLLLKTYLNRITPSVKK